MRKYAVEVRYQQTHLKHVIVEAERPEEACRRAIESTWELTDRANGLEVIKVNDDYDSSDDYVTGLWASDDPEEEPRPYRCDPVDIPEKYAEPDDVYAVRLGMSTRRE
jgi:hypothetical protein